MKEKNKYTEFTQGDELKDTKFGSVRDFLTGNILTKEIVIRQLPYIFFLALLAIVYIANRYNAEKVMRQTVVLQNELKEMRSESITTASELMFISKQSEVSKLVKIKGLDLYESVEPPKKIIVDE